jgi:uncharacterized protein (TIGR04562 family)
MPPLLDAHLKTQFEFDQTSLSVVASGESMLDQKSLNIKNFDDANSFIQSYGFDFSNPLEQERLWYFHRRALVLITERLEYSLEEIPEQIRRPEVLVDIRNLLIWSSSTNLVTKESKQLQRWSCAVLRCMHVFIHSEIDLYNSFSEEIQKQIMLPVENAILHSDKLFLKSEFEQIEICKFDTKPLKSSQSAVIKLLAKPDTSALRVFDKLGFRFVTQSVFDVFRVIRFLVKNNLMSFAHIMPDQSSNNMYPVKEFLEFCDSIVHSTSKSLQNEIGDSQKIDEALMTYLKSHENKFFKLFRKENSFSAQEFKYIKFICRRLIRVPLSMPDKGQKDFQFFYPFEVQIMTKDVFDRVQTGDSEHTAYKNRQIKAARQRILPD